MWNRPVLLTFSGVGVPREAYVQLVLDSYKQRDAWSWRVWGVGAGGPCPGRVLVARRLILGLPVLLIMLLVSRGIIICWAMVVPRLPLALVLVIMPVFVRVLCAGLVF